MDRRKLKKAATLVFIFAALGVMTTLVSYSVTLYRLFCQVTGANGTTQRVAADTAKLAGKTVTVFFNTNVAPGMPWRFEPVQSQVRIKLGQQALVFFEAQNRADHAIVGHATFNVTPAKAGIYFKKIQCFCFTEERLGAGQKVEMPVDFFVDPRLASDPNTADVDQITLSYTFFQSLKPKGAADLARFSSAPPSAAAGQQLFAQTCSACHGLDHAKEGPGLRGVFGRKAGSTGGYPYSSGLAKADFVWTAGRLDKWLANPQAFVPGALMPYHVDDPARRRDIIAYLRTLSAPAAATRAQD
ncbi:MAG TPA: cytochrome c oxidase assembly protein [Acetobacteraceae bacterium]|nr:cytochrome c oxidase assembly protein [Acetobacteraceae bacterium]